jgi:ABC-type phosphate/phosphonate transport system substrate-binding protein
MRSPSVALLAIVAAAAIAACGGSSSTTAPTSAGNVVTFKATMNGVSENPANSSPGTGTFTATLDTVTNVFTWDVVFSGLTSNVTAGHIHGPVEIASLNAGTTINFASSPGATFSIGQTTGTAHGTATLTAATAITAAINGDSLKKLLFAAKTYANVHTVNNPGGEIRGTIVKQ